MKININLHSYIFSVFGGVYQNGSFAISNLYGTASYIGSHTFVTTEHTILNAKQHQLMAVGIPMQKNGDMEYAIFEEYTALRCIDMATFKAYSEMRLKPFRIKFSPVNMLDDVYAFGFPHGLDFQTGTLKYRSFKGYIVNHGNLHEFPANPISYELSFQCPKGISGAPLLSFSDEVNDFVVIGYIIGNSNTEIVVFSEKEVSQEDKIERYYERTESTKFGIAISAEELIGMVPFKNLSVSI